MKRVQWALMGFLVAAPAYVAGQAGEKSAVPSDLEEAAPAPEPDAAGSMLAPVSVLAPTPEIVVRAVLTTAVREHEPVDEIGRLSNDTDELFFFTEIRDGEGRILTHRWEHSGNVIAEVPLPIRGPRWRTYSSKKLDPGWLGSWTVSVVDEAGRVLRSATFAYVKAEVRLEPILEVPETTIPETLPATPEAL